MKLIDFIKESNRIEGINRPALDSEVHAHKKFLALDKISVADLEAFVSAVQPGAVLRRTVGLNVRVGRHIAPPGGPDIEVRLNDILRLGEKLGAYETHLYYETLHPFTDGNGRSGRALWLWQMDGESPIGFLHRFYYQALNAGRPTPSTIGAGGEE